MRRVIFGSNRLGQTRFCLTCQQNRRLAWRSQPSVGTVYDSGDKDERYEEELTCGHTLDTWIYAGGETISLEIR